MAHGLRPVATVGPRGSVAVPGPAGAREGRHRLGRWHATYPSEDSSAARARSEMVSALRRIGVDGPELDDAELVAAELATNAIVHAATPFTVVAQADGALVRVEVCDGSPRAPQLLGPHPESWPGLGLHIVAGLATAWGWQRRLGVRGKVVWAEVGREGSQMRPTAVGGDATEPGGLTRFTF